MKPLKVEFQAFGPYAGYEVVDFEGLKSKGLFLICGKTGTGKTMILDAITFALYGKSSGSGRDDFEALRCTKADEGIDSFVRFEFEHNGKYYIFERRLEKKRKNYSKAYNLLVKENGGDYKPMFENARMKDLDEKAVEIIGLEYSQFVQVIVLPQGKFEKLLTSGSDEKEKILTSIFGEEKWQQIADSIFEEALAHKNELKAVKDEITLRLKEENCTEIAELNALIEGKKSKLDELTLEHKNAGLEAELKRYNDLLIVANRFEDLGKAEDTARSLHEQKSEHLLNIEKEKNALRAEKVKKLIDELELSKKRLETRKKELADAIELVDIKSEQLKEANEKLDEHISKEEEIKELNIKKLQYENKRAGYAEIESVSLKLKNVQKEETEKKKELMASKERYDAFSLRLDAVSIECQKISEEFNEYLRIYRNGIAGVLAEGLTDGMSCPVCGSLNHPNKAAKAMESITDADVDLKKKEQDDKYEELSRIRNEQSKAKSEYDELSASYESIKTEVVSIEAKLDSLKGGIVTGIGSLRELEEYIEKLSDEIENYEKNKQVLSENVRSAELFFADAKAKVEPAKLEESAALEEYTRCEISVKNSLSENSFTSTEEVLSLVLSEGQLETLKQNIADYEAATALADKTVKELKDELKDHSKPDVSECKQKTDELRDRIEQFTKVSAVLSSEIERLAGKADELAFKGKHIEERIKQSDEDYAFAKKLRGDSGTGLQRYVLGIMFSSVVSAANQMLELIHDGRYRLFRSEDASGSSKKSGLELKVYDKYSEESEGRFVNTLSGGEKFLASLALSIGMSTVASGSGIKIEALFIDEGFGSLDDDSIEDAMNILESIQKASGLVGIISHVQLLEDRIPTKLLVTGTDMGSHIISSVG